MLGVLDRRAPLSVDPGLARRRPVTETVLRSYLEEVEDLLASTYGWADTFVVLALLFPHVNTRNLHHVDHVYPRSLLTAAKLKKAKDMSDEDPDPASWYRDRLANLQLLEGPENVAKKDRNPLDWAKAAFDQHQYASYRNLNALPELPGTVGEFPGWCEQRYKLLERRLADLLSVDIPQLDSSTGP